MDHNSLIVRDIHKQTTSFGDFYRPGRGTDHMEFTFSKVKNGENHGPPNDGWVALSYRTSIAMTDFKASHCLWTMKDVYNGMR